MTEKETIAVGHLLAGGGETIAYSAIALLVAIWQGRHRRSHLLT